MGRWRLHAAATLIGAAWLCAAPGAFAQTSVLPSPADTSELRELQVAYATGPDRSTLWFGARIYGASDEVFVLVPAAPGAMVDTTSDAWFEALRLATNPRILPPTTTPPGCAKGTPPAAGSYDVVGDANHTASRPPADGSTVRTFSEVVLWAQGVGLNLAFEQLSVLADLDVAGYRFVTIPFDANPGETVLRTIRVVSPGATARVPLLLSRTGASPARAFVWVLGEGKATPTGWPWTSVEAPKLAWKLDGTLPRTNYEQLWSAALDNQDNQAWMLDAASHALLLSTTSFASGKASVPSVASTFFARASGYGDGDPDFQPCVMRVEAMDSAPSKVAAACAPGALALVPSADAGACSEQAGAGEIDPAELRCGAGADDLALAFAGMTPSKVWVTRWTGRIGAWRSRADEPFKIETGAPLLPVLACPNWDSSGCEADAGGGTGGPGAGTDAGTPAPGQGGGSVPGGSTPYDPGQDQPSQDDTADTSGSVYVETSCWGDSTSSSSSGDSSGGDSCGGDSSSSSSSSSSEDDSACNGDSSSSSSDESSACGGDSSSSSDGDSACGGDSSSSSSSGDSCSGSSSSGEDSACSGSSSSSSSSGSSGCSGGGSSSGSSDCSISSRGRRGGRLPMSAMTLLIVAGVWPLRRWRRAAERRPVSGAGAS